MTDYLSLPRRSFLFWSAAAAATLMIRPDTASAAVDQFRTLTLHANWSDEDFRGPYYEKGRYLPDALAEINHLFRDRHNQMVTKIDIRLLDLLNRFAAQAAYKNPLEVICGYRSRSTNNDLLHEGKKVAKDSLHIFGRAVDLRFKGLPLKQARKIAIAMQGGGVGYYRKQNFLHLDVGPVRKW
ncbi:MAG TPA: DUF882 domain-containing protein [Dongiaceae bacterium]|jgi:uncharacterized protein YcbK (DUF882 family)